MSPKKTAEDKIQIRQFKDKSSNFFINYAHYCINENEEIVWCAGETDKEELREAFKNYIRRNKKKFSIREESIFETEEIEYSVLSFGKHKNLRLNEVKEIEPKYLKWLYETTQDSKLKEELKILLKK